MRWHKLHPIFNILYQTAVSYAAPVNLSYFWNFGVYALVCLAIQVLTGIFLAMHYTGDIFLAFSSIEFFVRDIDYGWLLRYVHANGASMFFVTIYVHIFRGFYYSSFAHPRTALWLVGVVIFFLTIITAFMGYVLPWGQMSYWAATVITSLLTAIPQIGTDIVVWIWGGFAINNSTLIRFFAFHYLFPFILLGAVGLHIILLHQHGSNNPLGILGAPDLTSFSPFYIVKDLLGTIIFFGFFGFFVFFVPNMLGDPINYVQANPLVTPPHIVPEWYFLPFYAILRSIPEKQTGVLGMLGSILMLAFIVLLLRAEIRSFRFRPVSKAIFWVFIVVCLILGWSGGVSMSSPFLEIGRFVTILYFIYFIVSPILIWLEQFFWRNESYLTNIVLIILYKFRNSVTKVT